MIELWIWKSVQPCALSFLHFIRAQYKTEAFSKPCACILHFSILELACKSHTLACQFCQRSYYVMKYRTILERKLSKSADGGMTQFWKSELYCIRLSIVRVRNDDKLFNCMYRIRSHWTTSDCMTWTWYDMELLHSARLVARRDTSMEKQKINMIELKKSWSYREQSQVRLLWFLLCKPRIAKRKIALSRIRQLNKS